MIKTTHRWEVRSLTAHLESPGHQAMYAVVHGGVDKTMREESAKFLSSQPFDGYAIGGSMGKTKDEMVEMLTSLMPHLPDEKPNHLLGIADMTSLNACIPLGIDTFDSSYPTKAARHGSLITEAGPLNITRGIFSRQHTPIEPSCSCYTCRHYTLSYLHHLFKAKEVAGHTLATIHNLHALVSFMARQRDLILEDRI